jgi:hypothetical protein
VVITMTADLAEGTVFRLPNAIAIGTDSRVVVGFVIRARPGVELRR